jgi:hypothetical protein
VTTYLNADVATEDAAFEADTLLLLERDNASLLAEVARLRAREKKIAPVLGDVAFMGWMMHPQMGWFCPFGCHIRIPEEAEKQHALFVPKPPPHRPECGILVAQELRQSGPL